LKNAYVRKIIITNKGGETLENICLAEEFAE
jgi:hypothetical protein